MATLTGDQVIEIGKLQLRQDGIGVGTDHYLRVYRITAVDASDDIPIDNNAVSAAILFQSAGTPTISLQDSGSDGITDVARTATAAVGSEITFGVVHSQRVNFSPRVVA